MQIYHTHASLTMTVDITIKTDAECHSKLNLACSFMGAVVFSVLLK